MCFNFAPLIIILAQPLLKLCEEDNGKIKASNGCSIFMSCSICSMLWYSLSLFNEFFLYKAIIFQYIFFLYNRNSFFLQSINAQPAQYEDMRMPTQDSTTMFICIESTNFLLWEHNDANGLQGRWLSIAPFKLFCLLKAFPMDNFILLFHRKQ